MGIARFLVVIMCVGSAGCGAFILPCTEDRDCALGGVCGADGACLEGGPRASSVGVGRGDRAPLPAPLLSAIDERAGGVGLPRSCAEVLENDPEAASGAHDILDRERRLVTVQCDMESDGGGWTLVADVGAGRCPAGWVANPLGCDRGDAPIAAATFPIPVAFHEVRGEARAIAQGENQGFLVLGDDLDFVYVDGLSLTLRAGEPDTLDEPDAPDERAHLWTFAAGFEDGIGACPCAGGADAPAIVSEDYSCSSPVAGRLWEGVDDCSEDEPSFRRATAFGDRVEARIMSPTLSSLGLSGRVFVTRLVIAVR